MQLSSEKLPPAEVEWNESVKVESSSVEHGEPLRRVYNTWTASAYQVLMMASWTCNVVLYSTVFDVGGAMMLIYGTFIVTIGQCFVMGSLAEMCAIWPYAGGQQAFTHRLAPLRFRRVLSYFVGWTVLLGEIATAAGCAMNNAQILLAIVQLFSPDFVPQRWQTWLLYVALVCVSTMLSAFQSLLPLISAIGGILTLFGGIGWAASFLAVAPKHSASFVFGTFINASGYESKGWVGTMSLYSPLYALYGTDGILHIAEEIKDAERSAPRAMMWSMMFSGATSLAGAIVMGFCAGDYEAYVGSDGVPFISWFAGVLQSYAGCAVLAIAVIFLLNLLIVIGINTAASRLAWSMARDNALPKSPVIMKINERAGTPVNSLMLVAAAEIIIGIIVFGSDYAFQAIVSIGNVSIQIGYLIPILMLVLRGRDFFPAHRSFKLPLGLAVNLASICWSTLMVIILFFPLYVPINSATIYNMNWAIVIFGAMVLIVTIDWMLRGRHSYTPAGEDEH